MQGATEGLSRFVANTRLEDIPDRVVQNAKLLILDTVGVILAASRDSGCSDSDCGRGPCHWSHVVCERSLPRDSLDEAYEPAYVTLAKIHLSAGRSKEGVAALERLLQRNPNHAVAIELLRQWKPR